MFERVVERLLGDVEQGRLSGRAQRLGDSTVLDGELSLHPSAALHRAQALLERAGQSLPAERTRAEVVNEQAQVLERPGRRLADQGVDPRGAGCVSGLG